MDYNNTNNKIQNDDMQTFGMGAINKALDIVRAIAESMHGLTQIEIVQKTKIPNSTAKRIIHGLHMRGVLIQYSKGKSYFVNSALFCNRSVCTQEHSLTALINFVDAFYEKFNLTSAIYCRNGADGFAFYRKGMSSRLVEYSPEGLLLPLGSLVPTLGILAAMDPVEAHTVVESNSERIAGFDVHSIEYVLNLVNLMRVQGFLHVQGAWNPGRSYAIFPIVLNNGCEAALCAQAEREGNYSEHLQSATAYIRGFISGKRFIERN